MKDENLGGKKSNHQLKTWLKKKKETVREAIFVFKTQVTTFLPAYAKHVKTASGQRRCDYTFAMTDVWSFKEDSWQFYIFFYILHTVQQFPPV